MNEAMTKMTCEDFAAALASKASTPGGGGAAAYVGALGVALCSMAGNLTVGKRSYAHVENDVLRMIEEGEAIRKNLIALVDEDAAAFAPLAEAYAIPKEDPSRNGILESCTKAALAPPLQMMREVARCVDLLEEMRDKGSRLLVSDVGCGAACAAAALRCAALNVFVNTRALQDRTFAEAVETEVDELLAAAERADALAADITCLLRGKESL